MQGLDRTILADVLPHCREDALAIMLYGSSARGDSTSHSDVDILQVVPSRPGSATTGALSIVSYVPSQLERMAAEASLFAWHLRTEGRTIRDENRVLGTILAAHPGPNIEATLERVRCLTAVLDLGSAEFERHQEGLRRVARFLLRTAVYARALQAGCETFATGIAAATVEPSGELLGLLDRLRSHTPNSWHDFQQGTLQLSKLVGGHEPNPYGSLEALVVRSEMESPAISALGLHILSDAAGELDYSDARMPVL